MQTYLNNLIYELRAPWKQPIARGNVIREYNM